MTYFKISEYKFIKFVKSEAKHKKYTAIIKNKKNDKEIKINFGDTRYEHYEDKTPLKLNSNLDHDDKERRKKFRARHKGFIKKGYYSPAYFSYKYLW